VRGLGKIKQRSGAWVKRFLRSSGGNTAMMFGLVAVTVIMAGGAGIDMARAMTMKMRLAEALDAAALAVGTTSGLNTTQMQDMAQKYFDANYPNTALGTKNPVTVTVSGQTISLGVTGNVDTTLLRIVNINNLGLTVTNQVVRSVTKLNVALALDNTGSMSETDATGTSKMSALKTATHQLLTQLQGAAINPGDVKVAIIPFADDVNTSPSNYNATWLRWDLWDAANGANVTTNTTWCTGAAACGAGQAGCTGKPAVCTCSGSNASKKCISAVTAWVPNNHNTWNGCITDRDQSNDTQNTTPVSGNNPTLFPAHQDNFFGTPGCAVPFMGLGYDWNALNAKVDTFTPFGTTNQTIGLAWAWQALTQGAPLNAPAPDPYTQNVIILMSDGLNTQNRWYPFGSSGAQAAIDARMAIVCANAKAAGVTIYTVLVMAGNSSVLSNCASSPDKYYELTTAGAIVTAFNTIGTELANLHLSR
jgi:Flp pilus assembly protein TadG